jgi:glycosyltransferase involved in cell wall biosynthesis
LLKGLCGWSYELEARKDVKLLFVLPEYGPRVHGGIATYYAHLLPALVRLGARVQVCVTGYQCASATDKSFGINILQVEDRAIAEAKSRLVRFAPTPDLHHMLAVAYAAWETCGRGEGFDVVETADFGLTFAPWLATSGGPPVIVHLHGSSGQVDYHDPFIGHEFSGLILRILETALLGRAEELQSCGASNALEWSYRLRRPVEHIWPAWTPELTNDVATPPGPDLTRCGLVIGRIQSWKGPETLCRACTILGERAPKIVWVGRDHPYFSMDQSMGDYLKSAYPEHWENTVRPIGEVPHEAVIQMINAAKFIIVPSTWDTFNLAAVEAMSLGKIVICSEGAGAAGLIDHGKNGFRFPNGDAKRLAELLAEIDMMSLEECDAIGKAARKNVECKLAADAIAAVRLEHYANLAANGSKRRENIWGPNLGATNGNALPFAFLNQVPLKLMITNVAKRSLNKLRMVFR